VGQHDGAVSGHDGGAEKEKVEMKMKNINRRDRRGRCESFANYFFPDSSVLQYSGYM
jgi:predicted nucleotidyltransferase